MHIRVCAFQNRCRKGVNCHFVHITTFDDLSAIIHKELSRINDGLNSIGDHSQRKLKNQSIVDHEVFLVDEEDVTQQENKEDSNKTCSLDKNYYDSDDNGKKCEMIIYPETSGTHQEKEKWFD